MQVAVTMLATREDSKVLPVKREITPNQTVKGKANSFQQKRQTPTTLFKPSKHENSLCKQNYKRRASILWCLLKKNAIMPMLRSTGFRVTYALYRCICHVLYQHLHMHLTITYVTYITKKHLSTTINYIILTSLYTTSYNNKPVYAWLMNCHILYFDKMYVYQCKH